jgi:type IV pilus assembly protein PilY1
MNSSIPKALETAKTALWLRATASFLIFTLLWPSYAAAASTLLQKPPFTPIDPPANVMLMLDDSNSMNGHSLPMPADVTLATSTDPRLCNVAVTGYTTVESCGQVKLLTDTSSRIWVQEGNASPTPLLNGGVHVTVSLPGNWIARAAETVNGQNRILWQNTNGTTANISDDFLHFWNVTGTWALSSTSGNFAVNSADWKQQELDFWYDHNVDSKFGDSPVEWFDRVAISGYGGNEAGDWAERSFAVSRNDDWILRSPALNPLWYNPAVWYKPWNNNNQTTDAFPNANIGGSVLTTRYGAVTSRPDNTQLTQRDMRRVPTGTDTYTSVTTLAGTGAIGTWNNYPDPSGAANGRTVTGTLSSTAVRYSYAGMPLEHGATSISNSQTTASDAAPLDLFMRPVRTVTTSGAAWQRRTSCTDSTIQTYSENPGNLNCFKQQDCAGNWVYFASAPPTLNCYTRRTSCTNSANQTTDTDPGTLSCFQLTNCAGTSTTISETSPSSLSCWSRRTSCSNSTTMYGTLPTDPNPGTLSCAASRRTSCTNSTLINTTETIYCRQNCAGTATEEFTGDPGTLTCYRRRTSCTNSAWTTPTTTTQAPIYCQQNCEGTVTNEYTSDPGALTSCFQRRTSCTNSTNAGYSSDPGTIFCRNECDGTTVQTTTNPGSLSCWTRRTSCTNSAVQSYASDPSAIYCRSDCNGTVQQFTATQPSLTCWSRRASCSDSSTQFWTQSDSPGSISCSVGLELPVVYDPTGPTTSSTTPYLSGGSTNTVTSHSSSPLTRSVTTHNQSTVTRSVTTYAPTDAATYDVTTYSRDPSSISYSVSSTPRTSSPETFSVTTTTTTGTTTTGPHVDRLTPARYYYWNGTTANGGKGNPANYVLVQIDRTRPIIGVDDLVRYVIRDAATGVAVTDSLRNPGAATAQPGQCANGSWCTWEEEAQNFANWYAYYRNRMFSAIAVMAEAMSSMQEAKFQNLRIGYGRINYFAGATNPWNTVSTFTTIADIDGVANPGALIRGVRPFIVNSTARQQFFDWLFSLAWSGATPNREAVDSAGRYFTRTDNKGPWGETPGTESTLPHIPCRRNFTLLTTDGEWTNVSAGQPLISPTGPLTGFGSPTASDSVDGPTMTSGIDNSVFTYKPANFPQFTGGTSQDRTLTDATVYYWNRDLRPDLANVVKPVTGVGRTNEAFWQSMSTFIVGYGLFASMDTSVTRSAISAGTSVTWPSVDGVSTDTFNSANAANRVNDSFRAAVASRGQFYTATTVQALSEAVRSTFDELAVETGSSGGVALPGASLTGDNLFYRPSYFLGKHTYGKLEAFKVSDMTTLATNPEGVTPQWNASLPATRTILTSKDAVGSGQAFTAANVTNLSTTQQSQLGGGNASNAANVIKYLSGDTTLELANGGTFRNRVSLLGTFVNSQPLYSKAPDFGYAGLDTIGASYKTFVNNNKASPGRTAAVYIGGNAGMFHAFKAADGVELFSYVPRGVYENLYALTTPGIDHRFYVDGPVVQGDAYLGSAWKNIIVGTTGAGGASIFALDVTNPASMDTTKVLFDVTKAESDYLGHVLGTGVIGRIKTGTDAYEWVYIVGNGVESISNRAALLVISLEGSNKGVVRAIPVGPIWDNTDANRNGMGGINVVYGPQRSIVAVYGGDKQGNLWRFNFADGKPDNASGFGGSTDPLFTAKVGTTARPITTAPVLYPFSNDKLYIVFGTGKMYDSNDPTNADAQSLYGILYDPGQTTKILSSELNTVSIVDDKFNATHDGKRGWVIELDSAERVIGNPTIANSLIRISTFKPLASSNVCLGGGSSRLFSINVINAQGVVQSIAATSATPSPHFEPRQYGRTPTLTPTRAQIRENLRGQSSVPLSQCKVTTLSSDKSIGGAGQTACPQTPVLRVWRPLAR